MPKPNVQSVDAARQSIVDMLESISDADSPGFSRACIDGETIKLIECERSEDGAKGRIVVEMLTTDNMANQMGNLHGGAQATLLDNITSMVIYLHTSGVMGEPWSFTGVSQNINITYLAPIPIGSYMDIECTTMGIGKNVAVIKCEMWVKDGAGGKRLALGSTGTHTKIDNSNRSKL